MGKYILITGNPANGFTFYGPFDVADDATSYAEFLRLDDSWHVCPLNEAKCNDDGDWTK